jgi:hypothetical protein
VTSGALNSIGKIKTNGTGFTSYPVGMSPSGITSGPDGNLWFSETYSNSIGQFNPTTSKLTEYALPTLRSYPGGLVAGPGGPGGALVYFTERSRNRTGAVMNPASTGPLVSHSVVVSSGSKQANGLVLSRLASGNIVVSPPVVPNAGQTGAIVVSGQPSVLAPTTPLSTGKSLQQAPSGHGSTRANGPADVLFSNFKPALEAAL